MARLVQLAPLLDGATFVRDDAVVVRGRARGVVVGLGADGRTLRVATDDQSEDVAPADLTHAPLVADAPQFRKGARVVAKAGTATVKDQEAATVEKEAVLSEKILHECRVFFNDFGGSELCGNQISDAPSSTRCCLRGCVC